MDDGPRAAVDGDSGPGLHTYTLGSSDVFLLVGSRRQGIAGPSRLLSRSASRDLTAAPASKDTPFGDGRLPNRGDGIRLAETDLPRGRLRRSK